MITIEAYGLDQTINKLGKMSASVKTEVNGALNAFGLNVEQDAKQLVQANSSDTGQLAGSISYRTENMKTHVIAAVYYAAYVEFGTRKFATEQVAKLPPDWAAYAGTFKGKNAQSGSFHDFVIRMIKWAQSTGKIDPKYAYLAALKIIKNGVKARPFMYPSVNKNLPIFIEDLKDIFR